MIFSWTANSPGKANHRRCPQRRPELPLPLRLCSACRPRLPPPGVPCTPSRSAPIATKRSSKQESNVPQRIPTKEELEQVLRDRRSQPEAKSPPRR